MKIIFEKFYAFERMRMTGGTKSLKELYTITICLLLCPISRRLRFDPYRDSKIRSAGIIYLPYELVPRYYTSKLIPV